jgi:spermidine synthase
MLSGAASLMFQVVWVRRLIDVFGASSLAVATVLATFMAGLAIGAAIGGRLADRMAGRRGPLGDPLMAYAGCEVVVGLAALAVPPAIGALLPLSVWLWQNLSEQPLLLGGARALAVALVLLVPTTAMGATLPLLTRRVTRDAGDLGLLGRRVGALYAANTLGAVLGAYAAGYHLLPALGVTATGNVATTIALGLALAVAGTVVVRSRRAAAAATATEPASEAAEATVEPAATLDARPAPPAVEGRPRVRRAALIAYGLSGLVAMALEVFLARALAVVIGSSTYSFTLVLVTFLAGISLGAAVLGRFATRSRAPAHDLALVLAGTALAILVSHALIDDLPSVSLALLDGTRFEVGSVLTVHALLSAVTIVPIAFGLGAVVPLVMRLLTGELDRVGRDVGRAYAANTIGCIVGAVAAGFVLLPMIGLERGLRLAALLDGATALWLLYEARADRAPRRRRVAGGALIAVLAAALLAPGWNLSDFTAGLFRAHLARAYIDAGGLFDRGVAYYKDGPATTVSVERTGRSWMLKNNGKVEASNRADMPTQILVGLTPVLIHGGHEQRVFMVGYGSGVTVGAIAQSPTVARIDVAELEPAVYQAADRFFGEFNHRPDQDPRVHRMVGDGRNLLIASSEPYDVIVSEPSNPWIAGVASLFSRDFYRLARSRLAPGGVFAQWAQLYELGPTSVKMIYKTFASEFPYVYAFTPGDATTDTILLGSLRPLALDYGRLEQIMQDPRLRAELDRGEVADPADLLGSLFLAPGEVASFTAGAQINDDDNAALEHIAPRDLLASVRGNRFARAVRGETWPYGHLDGILSGTAGKEITLAQSLLGYGRRREATTWLAKGSGPERALLDRVVQLSAPVDYKDPEMVITAGGPPLAPPSPAAFAKDGEDGVRLLREAHPLIADGRWEAADKVLKQLPPRAKNDEGHDTTLLMAYAAYKAVHFNRAKRHLLALDRAMQGNRRPSIGYYLGRVEYGLGGFRAGVYALSRFAAGQPELAAEILRDRLAMRSP